MRLSGASKEIDSSLISTALAFRDRFANFTFFSGIEYFQIWKFLSDEEDSALLIKTGVELMTMFFVKNFDESWEDSSFLWRMERQTVLLKESFTYCVTMKGKRWLNWNFCYFRGMFRWTFLKFNENSDKVKFQLWGCSQKTSCNFLDSPPPPPPCVSRKQKKTLIITRGGGGLTVMWNLVSKFKEFNKNFENVWEKNRFFSCSALS